MSLTLLLLRRPLIIPKPRFIPTTTTTHHPFSTSRKMPGKQEWMAIIPDKPNALEARMAVRPQHLEAIKPKVASGLLVLGGASLDEPLKEGASPKINGSVMMVEADSEAEVWEVIKGDIYYEKGVWDAEKIKVFPFKSAVREGFKP